MVLKMWSWFIPPMGFKIHEIQGALMFRDDHAQSEIMHCIGFSWASKDISPQISMLNFLKNHRCSQFHCI